MSKCPACGYNSNTNHKNIGKDMNTILKSKSKNTVRMLNKIASKVSQNIPSENRFKYYQFLYGTKDVDDNVLEWAIEQFYKGRYYMHGKGFAYLRTVALARNQNESKMRESERKRIGSIPPIYLQQESE
tara:strand:- start:235 stop:621 length:387 start_codon:yes stop_codon:yes gene_type:complete